MSQSQQSTASEFPLFDILFQLCRSSHLQSYVVLLCQFSFLVQLIVFHVQLIFFLRLNNPFKLLLFFPADF